MKSFSHALLLGALLGGGLLMAQRSDASLTHSLTYETAAGVQADLLLTTQATTTPGVLRVINISGERSGETVLGLDRRYGGPDSEIFLNNTIVDDNGLAYDVEIGSSMVAINFFNRRNGQPYLEDNSVDNSTGFGNPSTDVLAQQLTLVPEVQIVPLSLGTVLLAWGVLARRRRRLES